MFIKFYLLNVQGLHPRSNQNKLKFIEDTLINENISFFILTETHLNDNFLDAEIRIKDYTIFRSDRVNRSHGGVALYIRNDSAAYTDVLCRFSNGTTDLLVLYLKNINLVIFIVYRPPKTQCHLFNDVIKKIKEILNNPPSKHTDFIIAGDFNFPGILWPNATIHTSNAEDKVQGNDLINMVNDHLLTQIVDKPTRESNILDLIFSNNPDMVHSIENFRTAISDHNMIKIITNIATKSSKYQVNSSYTKSDMDTLNLYNPNINWTEINKGLECIEWERKLCNQDVSSMLSIFKEECLKCCLNFIPSQKSRSKKSIVPRDRRILMKKRCNLRKKLKNGANNYGQLQNLIASIDLQILESHENQRILEETKAINSLTTNPKYFYSFANRSSKISSSVGPLFINKELTNNPTEMANILKKQYDNSFSVPRFDNESINDNFFVEDQERNIQDILKSIKINDDDIISAINSIPQNSAPGPDGFRPIFLKKCKYQLAFPLRCIWEKSLESGEVPRDLKHSIITPIYKGGNKGLPQNYRPVSLTSHLIKLVERIIREKIVIFLNRKDVFNNHQHGFIKGRSCLSQLLINYENVLDSIKDGANADVIYLDFSKAFDKVDHIILIKKLKEVGISGSIGKWLFNFITERKQQVKVQGYLSEISDVKSGVPQGTILGPLLFLIMINDIDSDIKSSSVSMFADDTKVLKKISDINDHSLLQEDLNSLINWTEYNNMEINETKFQLVSYGIQTGLKYPYGCNSNVILESSIVKDLGIYMNNDATFKYHVSCISTKVRKLLGWTLRTFKTRDTKLMVQIWKTLIIPHLEYCCQLWSTNSISVIQELESHQRQFTKYISDIKHLDYFERLSYLKIFSLQRRRERYCIIYVWKILEELVPNPGILSHYNDRRGRLCYVKDINASIRKIKSIIHNSFTYSGSRLFNKVPKDIRDTTNVNVDHFKLKLDKWLRSIPDQPPILGYKTPNGNSITDWIQ